MIFIQHPSKTLKKLKMEALPISRAAHFLGIFSIILVLIWCLVFRGGFAFESATNADITFNLHPILMIIGLVIGGEAIISYKCLPLRKPAKMLIHLALHAIALMIGVIGIYTAFRFHNVTHATNLRSLHSRVGIFFIFLYLIQWIYGFMVFFFPKGADSLQRKSLPLHIIFGMLIFIATVATAEFGYLEKLNLLESDGLYEYSPEALLLNAIGVVTFFFSAFVVLTTCCEPVLEDE